MRVLCPTCCGKGSIPDPKLIGVPMCYVGPNGEGCPHVFCQTCSGSGWVSHECRCNHDKQAPAPPPPAWPAQPDNFFPPGQSSISVYQSSTVSVG